MTETPTYQLGEPFCAACGHQLTGCVDSTRCPECGRPIIEVLTRRTASGRRYRSVTTLFGLPLIDVAYGPTDIEASGHAKGIFALGDRATGIIAVGNRAVGVVAFGGMAIGVISAGGMSFGLLAAWGGLALGGMASGGVAIGLLASGGLAIGLATSGGVVIGLYGLGGASMSQETNNAAVQSVLSNYTFFFGNASGFNLRSLIQPVAMVFGLAAAAAGLTGLIATATHFLKTRRLNSASTSREPGNES